MDSKRLLAILKVCFILFCINVSAAILVGFVQAFPDVFTIHMVDIVRLFGTPYVTIPVMPIILAVLSILLFLFVAIRVFRRIVYGSRRKQQAAEK